jgi:hypothetical protein
MHLAEQGQRGERLWELFHPYWLRCYSLLSGWLASLCLPFFSLHVSSATDKVIFLRWLHTVLLWLRLTMPFIFRTLGLLFFPD